MLTPITGNNLTAAEIRYNTDLVNTRCKVEQTFGILSNTWIAIKRARKIYYDPEKAAKIIKACCVLHNFRKLHG